MTAVGSLGEMRGNGKRGRPEPDHKQLTLFFRNVSGFPGKSPPEKNVLQIFPANGSES